MTICKIFLNVVFCHFSVLSFILKFNNSALIFQFLNLYKIRGISVLKEGLFCPRKFPVATYTSVHLGNLKKPTHDSRGVQRAEDGTKRPHGQL